ncbi:MAG TPA: hypothetical protein VIM16_15670 [Mucilaginibacter sp.]|jgi:hypothetical protein
MRKIYAKYRLLFIAALFLSMLMASCKKDHNTPTPIPAPAPLATLGLYEVDSSIYKRAFITISQIGTKKVTYYSVFDTGSAGMTIDANGILPTSMITGSGITVAGDSTVVNGITVTSQQAVIAYGDAQSEIQEYGNLAYTTVTIGDQNGNITTGRIPIFLYYKIVDTQTGQKQPAHSNDIFGVGPGVSYANSAIASPLSYFKSGTGATSGYKLATLSSSQFSVSGTYVSNLLTIGLVPADLESSSGFIMHPLTYYSQGGYSPDIGATVSYNGQNVAATVLFDTGTPAISTIENNSAPSNISTLPNNTPVTLTTSSGFTYTYTTSSTNNVTQVAKPSYTGDPRTIFSIDFFTENEFLMDYKNHQIGLKNN